MLGNLFRPKPVEVQEGEKIVQYDKDNLAEYRKMQAAEEVLRAQNTKGFRKPNNRDIARAKETIQDYRKKKAETFLEEHKARITYYGMEIKAYFDTLPNGLIKPSLTLADFNPFRDLAPVKPWSEAMEENLATRINCTHEMNDDETACKKCALNPENWGSNGEGVTNEYQDKQRAKIAAEKEKELACSRGEHIEDEAGKACVNCRKPKEMWIQAEAPKEQTTESTVAAD